MLGTPHQPSPLNEKNLLLLDPPSPVPHTKDLPLTDIGTSPPPFELAPLDEKRLCESSELSDLGDDESEAETDKLDFLHDEGLPLPDRTDLHQLSRLSDLQRLDSDSDDFDDTRVMKRRRVEQNQPALNQPAERAGSGSEEQEEQSQPEQSQIEQAQPEKTQPEQSGPDQAKTEQPDWEQPWDQPLAKDPADSSPESGSEAENGTSVLPGSPHDTLPHTEPSPGSLAEHELVVKDPSKDSTVLIANVENQEKHESDHESEHEPEHDQDDMEPEPVESKLSPAHVSDDETHEPEDGAVADEEDVKAEEVAAPEAEEAEEDGEAEITLDEERRAAIQELVAIENDFSVLRDKLYRDKLAQLEHELQLCLDGLHPELLQIYYKMNEYHQATIRTANATLNYSLRCINTETIATRTGIHQNFMKNLIDAKNEIVAETTSLWYKTNKEYNQLDHSAPEYSFLALPSLAPEQLLPLVPGGSCAEYFGEPPNKKAVKQSMLLELVSRRNCLDTQLGTLNGLKEFHGFPSAVTNSLLSEDHVAAEELLLRKATPDEVREDLLAMGILEAS